MQAAGHGCRSRLVSVNIGKHGIAKPYRLGISRVTARSTKRNDALKRVMERTWDAISRPPRVLQKKGVLDLVVPHRYNQERNS